MCLLSGGLVDGARGLRTPDLLTAHQALPQLSYSPVELVVGCVAYRVFLVVLGSRQSQIDVPPPANVGDRDVVAAVRLGTVRGDRVDLGCAVGRTDIALRRVSARARRDRDHTAAQGCRLALHAEQPPRDV